MAAYHHAADDGIMGPALAIVCIGDDVPSQIYIGQKIKKAQELNINASVHQLPRNVDAKICKELITSLNNNPDIHGIILQLPIPKHLNSRDLIDCIAPHKDVDGLTSINLGRLFCDAPPYYVPCTAQGCLHALDYTGVDLSGKTALVIGRSLLVGKSLIPLLLKRNMSVMSANSYTQNLNDLTTIADVIICATGHSHLLKAHHLQTRRPIVLDVGIQRVDGKIVGDVDYDTVADLTSWITPVPGGIGPLTVYSLMQNTLIAFYRKQTLNGFINATLT